MIVLETERLLFREHELEDLEPFCAMEADPEVRRYVGGAPRPREEAVRRFKKGLGTPKTDRLAMWATVYKPEGCYIGRCGVYQHIENFRPIPGEGSLAFYLVRSYWGRGLATEAGRAFVNFGFQKLALKKIVTTVQAGNSASMRVLEKLGFALVSVEEGEFRTFHHFELLPPYRDSGNR